MTEMQYDFKQPKQVTLHRYIMLENPPRFEVLIVSNHEGIKTQSFPICLRYGCSLVLNLFMI